MKLFLSILILLLSTNFAIAADVTVEMLNKLGKKKMVFSKRLSGLIAETQFYGKQQTKVITLNL